VDETLEIDEKRGETNLNKICFVVRAPWVIFLSRLELALQDVISHIG
jgi:hypothetical protein